MRLEIQIPEAVIPFHVQELKPEIIKWNVKKYHVIKLIRPEILTLKSVN
jgi:hypothetical protein